MRLRMITLLPLLLVAGLAGCSDAKKEMSKYDYAMEKIGKRWVAVRKNFATETPPNIYLGVILNKDFDDLVGAMERTYSKSNRDEVLPRLKKLAKKFKADMDAMVDIRFGTTKLMPGATMEGVGEAIEEAYAEFQEIEKLVK